MHDAMGWPITPIWKRVVDRWLDVSRAALGESGTKAASTAGQAMSMDEAIHYAREPVEATVRPSTGPLATACPPVRTACLRGSER